MKKLFIILLFSTTLFAQELEEFRGVKITDVDSQVLYSDKNITEAMDYLASVNINAILVVVLNGGYTQYPSIVMDSLFDGKKIDPSFTGRDPLERIIIEAHRNGIEVYPWFEYGFASHYSGGTPPFGGHILNKYPNWALRTRDNNICTKNGFDWMSAINPEVQNFINSLVKEVITNYDVDGIEFSDRIPALPIEGGYDSVTVAIYKNEHDGAEPPTNFNNSEWKRWRANKLNEWYHNVKNIIKDYDENLVVASSPSVYPWGYDNYLQDSQTWINEGIAEHFIPQLYRYNFNDYMFELNKSLTQVGENIEKLFPGLLLNIGTGDNLYVMSPEYLLNAIQANRNNGISGEVYFFYEGFKKNNNLIGDTLKATYYNEPARVPLRGGNIWRPKADILNETDGNVTKSENWIEYPMAGFEGKILRINDITKYNYLDYSFNVENKAVYDFFTYMVPNTNLTKNASYTVYSDNDSIQYNIDQSNMAKKGWQKISTIILSKGYHKVLKIDNSRLDEGEYLAADAAMLMINRKLSHDVFVTNLKEISKPTKIPNKIVLQQNFPNPFNPTTTIRYSLPKLDQLTIRQFNLSLLVYDVLGKKVRTLVNELQSPGNYEINFNSDNLSSGIYFYKLNYGSIQQIRKMIILK